MLVKLAVRAVLCCAVGFEANCPHLGPGPIEDMPSVRPFYEVLDRINASFGEINGKLRMARCLSAVKWLGKPTATPKVPGSNPG